MKGLVGVLLYTELESLVNHNLGWNVSFHFFGPLFYSFKNVSVGCSNVDKSIYHSWVRTSQLNLLQNYLQNTNVGNVFKRNFWSFNFPWWCGSRYNARVLGHPAEGATNLEKTRKFSGRNQCTASKKGARVCRIQLKYEFVVGPRLGWQTNFWGVFKRRAVKARRWYNSQSRSREELNGRKQWYVVYSLTSLRSHS